MNRLKIWRNQGRKSGLGSEHGTAPTLWASGQHGSPQGGRGSKRARLAIKISAPLLIGGTNVHESRAKPLIRLRLKPIS